MVYLIVYVSATALSSKATGDAALDAAITHAFGAIAIVATGYQRYRLLLTHLALSTRPRLGYFCYWRRRSCHPSLCRRSFHRYIRQQYRRRHSFRLFLRSRRHFQELHCQMD